MHATGTFEVKVTPAEPSDIAKAAETGRMTIDKHVDRCASERHQQGRDADRHHERERLHGLRRHGAVLDGTRRWPRRHAALSPHRGHAQRQSAASGGSGHRDRCRLRYGSVAGSSPEGWPITDRGRQCTGTTLAYRSADAGCSASLRASDSCAADGCTTWRIVIPTLMRSNVETPCRRQNYSGSEGIEKIQALDQRCSDRHADDCQSAEGTLHARPMAIPDKPFDGVLWFITRNDSGKTDEIRHDSQVLVSFAEPKDGKYICTFGPSGCGAGPCLDPRTLDSDGEGLVPGRTENDPNGSPDPDSRGRGAVLGDPAAAAWCALPSWHSPPSQERTRRTSATPATSRSENLRYFVFAVQAS